MRRSVSVEKDLHQGGPWNVRALTTRVAASHDASRRAARITAAASARLAASTASGLSALVTRATPRQLSASVTSLGRRSFQALGSLSRAASVASEATLEVGLDWRPTLTAAQEALAFGAAAATAGAAYCLTAPPAFSLPYATCIGLVFGLCLLAVRSALLEVQYKARERLAHELGDEDSKFSRLGALRVHLKAKEGAGLRRPAIAGDGAPAPLGVHCYHGFGANLWSWSLVQQRLAQQLGALVTAHDMPGFGLTSRPTDLSGYFLAFNGRLGRLILDFELAARGLLSPRSVQQEALASFPPATSLRSTADGSTPTTGPRGSDSGGPGSSDAALSASSSSSSLSSGGGVGGGGATAPAADAPGAVASPPHHQRAKLQRVLMGHSLGSACAALEAIDNPRDVSALVLVSPAIIAFGGGVSGIHLHQLDDSTELTRAHDPSQAAASGGSGGGDAAADATAGALAAAGAKAAGADAPAASALRAAAATSGAAGAGAGAGADAAAASTASTSPAGGAAAAERAPFARIGDAEVAFFAAQGSPTIRSPSPGRRSFVGVVVGLLQSLCLAAVLGLLTLLRPAVLLALRAAVRSRDFWSNALRQAYFDGDKLQPELVDKYRLPQLARSWDTGMADFLSARVSGSLGLRGLLRASVTGGALEDANLAQRLAAVVAAHDMPVLIIAGANDRLVPSANAVRLARMLKGARLALVQRCGHCPQEETPEAFVAIVARYLSERRVPAAAAS